MANFEIAYKRTAQFEGGWSCEEPDNGNWAGAKVGVGKCLGTIAGITAYEVKEFLGHEPTLDEVKNFPESSRKAIYKKKYWDKIMGDSLNEQEIANRMYDEAVNAGIGAAIKLAEELTSVKVDGKMDNNLLNSLNNIV